MPRITKVTTRRGDRGETGLGEGRSVDRRASAAVAGRGMPSLRITTGIQLRFATPSRVRVTSRMAESFSRISSNRANTKLPRLKAISLLPRFA